MSIKSQHPLILTLGHSRRSPEEFVELLWTHGVSLLVDVRQIPRSRWVPHFNRDSMAAWLAEAGVGYVSLPDLGGFRTPRTDSVNRGLVHEHFRAFADHMQSPAFADSFDVLLRVAADEQVAIVCAEREPERCHRHLIADLLVARGCAVEHILDADTHRPHTLTAGAVFNGKYLTYPA